MKFELELLEEQLELEAFEKVGKASIVKKKEITQASLGNAHFIEPVSQIIAVATVSMIAYRMVDHWLTQKEQGVLIDVRKDPALISRVSGVPNGFVHLIDNVGESKLVKFEYDKSNELKEILINFLGKSGSDDKVGGSA